MDAPIDSTSCFKVVRLGPPTEEIPSMKYVNRLITLAEGIFGIDPGFTEREILKFAARTIVEYFDAGGASLRISDPERKEMLFYGSYSNLGENLEKEHFHEKDPVRRRRSEHSRAL
jgi:hypothetical protein